jgi:hypothetical protein
MEMKYLFTLSAAGYTKFSHKTGTDLVMQINEYSYGKREQQAKSEESSPTSKPVLSNRNRESVISTFTGIRI